MDSQTIDRAMRERLPVVYDGRRHSRITHKVTWYDDAGNRRLSVDLQEGRTSYRVPADKVELLEVDP